MAYSDHAAAFARIPVSEQVRLEDRVSFAYLEKSVVYQDRTGVWAMCRPDSGDEESQDTGDCPIRELVQVPVGSIAVVMLGPGTSVTQPAMAAMANAGATVMFTGGGGFPSYATAVPLTSSSRWAHAQARLWCDNAGTLAAARNLYLARFGDLSAFGDPRSLPLTTLRGMEGRLVRSAYKQEAARVGLRSFRRDSSADDPVNIALNVANQILYGCAASACSALGVNPALGIIHRGNARALLFDLADVFKTAVSIPAAFDVASSPDPATIVRRAVRQRAHQEKLLPAMVRLLCDTLTPYLTEDLGDVLLDESGRTVLGHVNHSDEDDS